MRKLLRNFKPLVEKYPALAFLYRTIRDSWAFQRERPQVTPYGFTFRGHRAMQRGNFEFEETALLKELLEGVEVFVDVGANMGIYSCLSRSSGKYTIAIEPLAQNLNYLYANLDGNGWHDVEVVPVGLAQKPGLAILYGACMGASLLQGWADASPLLQRIIPLSTLDIVLGSRFRGKKLLIKVDVEGAEYGLLQGAGKTLALSPAPLWVVEIELTEHYPGGLNPNYVRTFEIFWKHGYRAWTANAERRPVSPEDVARWQELRKCEFGTGNYVFAQDGGHGFKG